ncbi:hypothetical protein RclHR1_01120023 [Rhizophagus clarus]|uniref:Protein kinase domain-containing protein n=1 Tax=Rhizophagus clarus TaxID=94130 RepID=A0A2Z6Q576_9GLOM|nr:hypothetical protein RclHR1_01120023 [Rhizophagus clarus]
MELIASTCNENSFNTASRLKSSSEPIQFISFNRHDDYCNYCGSYYDKTICFNQKYCRDCLLIYINNTDKIHIDVLIATYTSISCLRHKPKSLNFCILNIQEWCDNCSKVIYFNQVITNNNMDDYYNRKLFFWNEKYCKLCNKLVYQQNFNEIIKFCSDCYKISFGWVESILTKKTIPILYLPWWDASDQCISCNQFLESKSDYHKWCLFCSIIYIGCRYCLTTNIIFEITDQSQCKKCNRKLSITSSTINVEEEGSFVTKFNTYCYKQIANYMDNTDKNSNPLEFYNFMNKLCFPSKILKDWVSYSQIKNLGNNEKFSIPPIPIIFIPFNNNEGLCYYCKREYSVTRLFRQKYCKFCLFFYIKYSTKQNIDLSISTNNSDCSRHKPRSLNFHTRNIQVWCIYCSEILYFNQIITNNNMDDYYNKQNFIGNEEYCRLCGKLVYQQNNDEIKFCSDCYRISFGWVESILTKKTIPILYLPWWDASDQCIFCDQFLDHKSDYHKWCLFCSIIYIGCRYCLKTNIIFGITDQSKCKKCNRKLSITSSTINVEEEESFCYKINTYCYKQIANYMDNTDKNSNPLEFYNFMNKLCFPSKILKDWVSYSQIKNLGNNEKFSIPPIPIIFIPFNNNEGLCYYCKREYSVTRLFRQKYCKSCLFFYIKYSTNQNIDLSISTNNLGCGRHKSRGLNFYTRNIQEWCIYCSEILYFNQIITNNNMDGYYNNQKFFGNEIYCKLCGKLVYQKNYDEIKFCSDCYKISFGWVESILTKKTIPILYLPWWDASGQCIFCDQFLDHKSDYHKWCLFCSIIYIGCRYCLETNIIFGITVQSQCRKCKRVVFINMIVNNISEVLYDVQSIYNSKKNLIVDYVKNIGNYSPLDVCKFVKKTLFNSSADPLIIKRIPNSQITNLEQIARGGFGTIYKASWLGKDVAIKRFPNSQYLSKYFLNEVKSLFRCYNAAYVIKIYGITQDHETKDHMLVVEYAHGGDLHKYLQKNFANITWNKKLYILWKISEGLNAIHKRNFMHRDFHSGNILLSSYQSWLICDLGLSQHANNTLSNNEIYGVIPYIAPEILRVVHS